MKRWLIRRLPLFSLAPVAPFLMHGCFLCLECLLLAKLESLPHTPNLPEHGTKCGPCWKEGWMGLSWSCHTGLSGKGKRRQQEEERGLCKLPKGCEKSYKGSQNRNASTRDTGAQTGGGEKT